MQNAFTRILILIMASMLVSFSSSYVHANDAALKAADKNIRAKFKRWDDHMKQERYGNARWDSELQNRAKNVMLTIQDFEKKYPDQDTKPMWGGFQRRVNEIKQKMAALQQQQQAEADAKTAAKAKEQAKRQAAKDQAAADKLAKKQAAEQAAAQAAADKAAAVKPTVQNTQATYIKSGQVEIWDDSTDNLQRSNGGPAYLSFSSDYSKTDDPTIEFDGKQFIYAHAHLPKKLTDLLPAADAKGLQYYKVILQATVNGRTQANDNKIQIGEYFHFGHSTNLLPLAVVPEKAFFEHLLDRYRDNGNYPDGQTKAKALQDLSTRNFSRQMSYLFKDLEDGVHPVEMEFQVTAKLAGSKYVALKGIKGTFLLKVDSEARERYQNTFDMLTGLYQEYEAQRSIAEQTLDAASEEEKLAQMTPRERERYKIAKRSPTGYMAAYGGERAKITFSFGKLRTKNAYLDIVWPDGPCETCEAGTSSSMVSKRSSKTLNIPFGARVSLNGRSLINKVSKDQHVTLYWYH